MFVIPGTPPGCMLPANSHYDVAPVVSMIQVVACNNIVVSSLIHSNEVMASKLEH